MVTQRLFAEVIPILRPYLIPPPPLPVVSQPTPPVPKETPNVSISKPSFPLLPSLPDSSQAAVKTTGLMAMTTTLVTPTGGASKLSTPLSGHQRLQSRAGSKFLSCAVAPVVC